VAERKVELLLEHFETQRERRWFTSDLFFAVMRIRGMESNAPSRLAEGFYGRKVVLVAPTTGESRGTDAEPDLAVSPISTPLLDNV